MHCVRRAFSFAFASAGSNSEARIAMIAMTTSNSISVKAFRIPECFFICLRAHVDEPSDAFSRVMSHDRGYSTEVQKVLCTPAKQYRNSADIPTRHHTTFVLGRDNMRELRGECQCTDSAINLPFIDFVKTASANAGAQSHTFRTNVGFHYRMEPPRIRHRPKQRPTAFWPVLSNRNGGRRCLPICWSGRGLRCRGCTWRNGIRRAA